MPGSFQFVAFSFTIPDRQCSTVGCFHFNTIEYDANKVRCRSTLRRPGSTCFTPSDRAAQHQFSMIITQISVSQWEARNYSLIRKILSQVFQSGST